MKCAWEWKAVEKIHLGKKEKRSEGHKLLVVLSGAGRMGAGEQGLVGKVLIGHLKEIQGCYCMELTWVERGLLDEGWFGEPVASPP